MTPTTLRTQIHQIDGETCEDEQEDMDDILEWGTLTADASDRYVSEDDQDL